MGSEVRSSFSITNSVTFSVGYDALFPIAANGARPNTANPKIVLILILFKLLFDSSKISQRVSDYLNWSSALFIPRGCGFFEKPGTMRRGSVWIFDLFVLRNKKSKLGRLAAK